MKPAFIVAVLALIVALLSGCGSSGFHSATHDYAVHEVQAAFAVDRGRGRPSSGRGS